MKLGLGTAALLLMGCGLTPAQDASLAAAIEGAACQVAESVPNDPPIVGVICQIAGSIAGSVTTIYVKVPKSQVPAFLAANPAPDGGLNLSSLHKPGF
jgi:hypothetical protein